MRKRKSSLIQRRNRAGWFFCGHWVIGLVLFFLYPLISSIVYAFSDVYIGFNGLTVEFTGLENFRYILGEDANYLDNLQESVGGMLTNLPIIISLSLFLALILNSNFKGRLLFRAIFFLPVIIANSVTMTTLQSKYVNAPLFTITSGEEFTYGGMIDFNSLLTSFDLPTSVTELFSEYLSEVFNLIWSCGVPTILFLAGLQSISKQLYEVGSIEGANRWEMLWKVEIPMLRNVILLVLLFTMIELFTAMDSPVISQVSNLMFENQIYNTSSSMLWCYFMIVGVIMGIVLLAYNKYCMRKWE